MILITGAGGKTGKAIIKLLSKVESVCAFVHREEQIPELKTLGAEKIIVGDLRDESAIHIAMKDVRRVYHICPNMHLNEVEIGKLMIKAAKKEGVEYFVYHSVLHPQTEKMNHHWQKLRMEETLFESDIPFSVLQPAPYMQNLLAGWKSILEYGILRVPYSVDARFSFIDLEDLANVVRIVLTESGHKNATYELAGTLPTSHVDVAEIISRVLNQDVRAEKEEIGDWKLRAKGLSVFAVENLIKMFEYYDQWGLAGNPNVLRWILKREPISLKSFTERVVSEQDDTN